jgi:hypothetical protein
MSSGLPRRALLKAGGAVAATAVGPQLGLIGVWDAALKNYAPNLGYDWGGRLMAAWLDR